MKPENPEKSIDAVEEENTYWDQQGSFLMRDFVGGFVFKTGYFGPMEGQTWEQFFAFIDKIPMPTVQENYTEMMQRYGKISWEDDKQMSLVIKKCPNKIAEINRIAAALNTTRDVTAYKKLINRLILTTYPEAATDQRTAFHRDVD